MIKENKICAFKVVNEIVTAVTVFNKNSFNHQFKSNNNFITVFLNSLQKHFCVF